MRDLLIAIVFTLVGIAIKEIFPQFQVRKFLSASAEVIARTGKEILDKSLEDDTVVFDLGTTDTSSNTKLIENTGDMYIIEDSCNKCYVVWWVGRNPDAAKVRSIIQDIQGATYDRTEDIEGELNFYFMADTPSIKESVAQRLQEL